MSPDTTKTLALLRRLACDSNGRDRDLMISSRRTIEDCHRVLEQFYADHPHIVSERRDDS